MQPYQGLPLMRARFRVGLTVLTLVVAACTGEEDIPRTTPTPTVSSTSPVSSACDSLVDLELDEVITLSAELVTTGSLPESCRVSLTVDPAINIEVWLPTDGYNNRFQGVGGGGYAGEINVGGMAEALGAGYAPASTDTGHVGQDFDGSFALTADGTL